MLTEEFLDATTKNVKITQKAIQVKHTSTQTDAPKDTGNKTNADYSELKRKYEMARQEIKRIKLLLKNVKNGVLSAVSQIDTKDFEMNEAHPRNVFGNHNCASRFDSNEENDPETVSIGPGKTKVSVSAYQSINWTNYSAATRKLLLLLFPRNVLATHSLTGKPSPAFCDKEAKMR